MWTTLYNFKTKIQKRKITSKSILFVTAFNGSESSWKVIKANHLWDYLFLSSMHQYFLNKNRQALAWTELIFKIFSWESESNFVDIYLQLNGLKWNKFKYIWDRINKKCALLYTIHLLKNIFVISLGNVHVLLERCHALSSNYSLL